MAFITHDTFVIMNKKKYQESLIPPKEQRLNQIKKKQKELHIKLIEDINFHIVYPDDDNGCNDNGCNDNISIIYKEASYVTDGCYCCNKSIPCFWPLLWQFQWNLEFIMRCNNYVPNKDDGTEQTIHEYINDILCKINVTSKGYTINNLLNYAYGCCSNECRKRVTKKCIVCQTRIKPSEFYSVQRYCSNECYHDDLTFISRSRKY
jgi:hypothetical protein